METKIIRLFNRYKLRTLQLVLLGLLLISSHTHAQQISNVVAEQNGKSIVVKYDITAKVDQSYSISLLYSSDGVIWKEAITGLSGDIGNNQKGSGTKQITWLPLSELPKLVGNGYSFKVKGKIAAKGQINYRYIETINGKKIIIPENFSQSDDFTNQFEIQIENEEKFSLSIYNPFGDFVFNTKDKNNMWNGCYENDYNTKCLEGECHYVLQYKIKGDIEKVVNGNIFLKWE